jgi:hypothetical protein
VRALVRRPQIHEMFRQASALVPTARQMSRQVTPGPGATFTQSGCQIGGRPSSGAAAAGKEGSGRQQLTGFEGCEPLFSDPAMYPAYSGGACQAQHSGKVGRARCCGLSARAVGRNALPAL